MKADSRLLWMMAVRLVLRHPKLCIHSRKARVGGLAFFLTKLYPKVVVGGQVEEQQISKLGQSASMVAMSSS